MKITQLLTLEDRIKNSLKVIIKKHFGHNERLIRLLKSLNPPSIRHLILTRNPDIEDNCVPIRAESDQEREYLSARWGQIAKERLYNQHADTKMVTNWLDSEIVERYYIRPNVSGNQDVWWLTYVAQKYIPRKLDYGVSLGCGNGLYERVCVQADIAARMDGYDISTGAIEVARTASEDEGLGSFINYHVEDINSIQLPADTYDLALCNMSLHHFEGLEHVFSEISKSLKKNGLFVFNEFVGPSQFQWTDKQLVIINNLLAILPEKYRYQPKYKCYKTEFVRPSIDDMNATDPSEAVRSKEILPIAEQFFCVIERKEYGGTIINMLLQDIISNFDENSQEDMTILKLIFYIEGILLREKCIESDHAMVVCTKK